MFVKLRPGDWRERHAETPINTNDGAHVSIVAPGIVVSFPESSMPGVRTFYPWHRIEYITGEPAEYEHELAQLYYLGVSDG